MASERREDPGLVACAGVRVRIRRVAVGEILALRHVELRPGLPLETARFDGDLEPAARHFAAVLVGAAADAGPAVVGCASFMARDHDGAPAHQLRGMATRADLRGRGIGAALLRLALAEIAARDGARRFWCNARVAAVPFYARLGWAVVSDVFDVPTVGPHRVMTYHAPGA